jgi:DNA polymerase-1
LLEEVNVHYVDTVDDAAEFLRWLGQRRPILAIDTETGGLSYTRDALKLVQFGDGMTGWAISYRNWRGLIDRALALLRRNKQPVVFHNAKFDMHFMEHNDLPVPHWSNVHDTKLMDHLLDPLRPHGLKPMAERVYGPRAGVGQALLKQTMTKHSWNWATVPDDHPHYWGYGALDTVLTARLAELHWPAVNSAGLREAYDRESATQAILYRSERRGMRVDVAYTVELRQKWMLEMASLETFLADAGVGNPNAARQIVAALSAKGWEPDEFTPNGEPKLDKKVLSKLNSDVADAVLRYRKLRKWTSTYLDTFLAEKDGSDHLHASINTMAAKTGRMSINNPPFQTLPRGPEIRDAIIPDEGGMIVAIDYDSMEFRGFAHFAQEAQMLDAIRRNLDPHIFAAAMVYGVPYESITKDDPRRQITKNTQYGKIYGAGVAKIAETAGVPEHEAAAFVKGYEQTFPGVPGFQRQVEAIARKRLADTGRAFVTTWGGRVSPAHPDQLYALVNYLIQGTCADLFKQKIVDLDAAGLGDDILLPVHDELLFDFPAEEAEERGRVAASIMEETEAFLVPFTVEPSKPLDRWGTKYRKGA